MLTRVSVVGVSVYTLYFFLFAADIARFRISLAIRTIQLTVAIVSSLLIV